MKAYIAGKPLLSTTDWPSTVSCVVFFVGCNLRCRFCFNAPLLEFDKQFLVDLEQIYPELEAHRFLADGVIVTGGEPTIQSEPLYELAQWVKQQNFKFGIMTNGTKPDVIQRLISDQLIDYVAVDIKTIPQAKTYANITQSNEAILPLIKETIALLKASQIEYEFRTTLVPKLVEDLNQLKKIIQWVGSDHYVLQVFRPTETVLDLKLIQASFTTEELNRFQTFAQQNGLLTRF